MPHRLAVPSIGAIALALALTAPARAEEASPAPKVDGAALWQANCATCHGPAGTGDTPKGRKMEIRDLTARAFQTSRTDGQIRATILDGLHEIPEKGPEKEMHAFRGKLTDPQIAALIAHVRSLAAAE